MKGDFSRGTFDPQKHYAGVRMQQGRVQLDADWNEQVDIAAHRIETETIDVIGRCGAPIHDAGFAITPKDKELMISAGRYYVDGLLCENEADRLPFSQQPDLPNRPDLPNPPDWITQIQEAQTTLGIVYLDVWQRHITALDDSHLREVALGGPDTTTRIKTVWQVKVLPVQVDQFNPDEFRAFLTDFIQVLKQAAGANFDVKEDLAKLAIVVLQRPDAFKKQFKTKPGEIKGELHEILTKLTPLARQAKNDQLNAALKQYASFVDQIGATADIKCDSPFKEWDKLIAPGTGTLNAHTVMPPASDDPCQIPPSAGYRSLENQLYRVEIHNNNSQTGDNSATFKWSRDNGSVVTGIEKFDGQKITVHDTGPDDVLGFASGQWVEISDDAWELNGMPGQLVQIDTVHTTTRQIILKTAPTPLDATNGDGVNKLRHPKLRRWDQSAANATNGIPIATGWVALENGIEVQFNGATYNTGDYWLIPARTASGEIEWPPFTVPNTKLNPPPLGITHHYCRLALVQFVQEVWKVTDCRNLFPSLTEITCCTAKALHVTFTNWDNDDVFKNETFLQEGLRIRLDAPPDPNSLNDNSVIVTMEIPFNSGLLQSVIVPAGKISLINNEIVWQPNLKSLPPQPQRVRVTLKGHIIWSAEPDDGQNARKYLDGQAFGHPGDEKSPRTALTFQTGAGAKASDFESWFRLDNPPSNPPLQITEVAFFNVDKQPIMAQIPSFPLSPTTKPVQVSIDLGFKSIQLTFSRAVRRDNLEQANDSSQSIRVESLKEDGTVSGGVMGDIKLITDTVAQFSFRGESRSFTPGNYLLTVFGKEDLPVLAVQSVDNTNLDGDFIDGPGGNFVLPFDLVKI